MNTQDNNAFMTDKFTLKPSPQVVERVREFLNEQLQHLALDCENIYLNTVNNIVDMRGSSQPLTCFSSTSCLSLRLLVMV